MIKQGVIKHNVWAGFDLKRTNSTNKSVTAKEFEGLLAAISPVDSIKIFGRTKRNLFRPWIKNLLRLKIYTGLRDEELFALKWNMIEFEGDTPIVVCSPNIKVNKAKNYFKQEEYEYNYVPVACELAQLFIELGLDKNRGSEEYVIAQGVSRTASVLKNYRRSVNFYFEKAFPNKGLKGKFLRHTYTTALNMHVPKISLTHSAFRTTEKHYLDKKNIAAQIAKTDFRVFPDLKFDGQKKEKCTPSQEKQDTPKTKKGTQLPESLDMTGGRYWVRTSDPLLVRQVL